MKAIQKSHFTYINDPGGIIMTTYRIHGDNVVECERIANLIINEVNPLESNYYLISPSTITVAIFGI